MSNNRDDVVLASSVAGAAVSFPLSAAEASAYEVCAYVQTLHCIVSILVSFSIECLNIDHNCSPQIADTSSLSDVALAYVRARNADPMCSFGDFAGT